MSNKASRKRTCHTYLRRRRDRHKLVLTSPSLRMRVNQSRSKPEAGKKSFSIADDPLRKRILIMGSNGFVIPPYSLERAIVQVCVTMLNRI